MSDMRSGWRPVRGHKGGEGPGASVLQGRGWEAERAGAVHPGGEHAEEGSQQCLEIPEGKV